MTDREINAFLAKKSKTAKVLEALLNKEYVTCSDIIELTNTTCPHSVIRQLRKIFGYDYILDREVKFFRTFYKDNGQPYKVSDTYKQYFLNKVGA